MTLWEQSHELQQYVVFQTTLTVCSKVEIRYYCPCPPLAMDLNVCLKRKIQLCSGSIISNFVTFSGRAIITSQVKWETLTPGQFRLKCTRETRKKLSEYHLDLHTPPFFVIVSTQKSIISFHSITPPLNQVHWSHRCLYCIKPSVKYHIHSVVKVESFSYRNGLVFINTVPTFQP